MSLTPVRIHQVVPEKWKQLYEVWHVMLIEKTKIYKCIWKIKYWKQGETGYKVHFSADGCL